MFYPLPALFNSHYILQHSLYKAVYGESLLLTVTLDQGVGQESTESFIQFKGVSCNLSKRFAEMLSAASNNLFGDVVGGQEGEEAQQVGSGRVALSDALEGERPGGGNWLRMVRNDVATLSKQFGAALLVEAQVLGEAGLRFFDIGASLVEGQWQAAKLSGNLQG
ncbi:hypothetical protein [Ktedonobacter sp. SOSP1-85]|uniref:hypothetical protein n=1 Tax=Ktedonobacter sp. SOSP1-85 TaxID=2778367 RepID=UPI00191597CB|nr:hypothetical protein [Ktedonobacter sp. SOSP1-85]